MKKKFFCFLLLTLSKVQAQDIHFSQFFNSTQNLNPALIGVYNGDLRLEANHKNQWRTVPVAYRTYSIAVDGRLPLGLKNDIVSAGILLNNDKSGDGAFISNKLAFSFAYLKRLNKDSTSFLSIGLQPSFASKSFNLSKLSFNNQFNDGAYNAAINSDEKFSTSKVHYFDLAGGINYLQKFGQNSSLSIGFTYSHFQKQNISFLSDKSVVTNPKYVAHATFVFASSENFEFIPVGLYQFQNKNKEIVAGALARFIFENKVDKLRAFSIGGLIRVKDAFILDAQLDYNRFRYGLSYDINTSNLKKASNGLGGFELSLIYIIKRFARVRGSKVICPVFL